MEKSLPSNYSAPSYAGTPPQYGPPPGISHHPHPLGTATSYPSPSAIVVFGPKPQIIICPSCNAHVTTRVVAESSSKTHMIAVCLCLFTGCCCIPYCIDSCKSRNHYCPSCGTYLGAYNN